MHPLVWLKSCGLLIVLISLCAPKLVFADVIAIIGTGQVAKALGPEFAQLGHVIVYGSREPMRDDVIALVARTKNKASATTPPEAVLAADIVVLAVPGEAVETVIKSLGDLSGKIIIDPTNVLHKGRDGLFELGVETSNAEMIQGWAPDAFVVKAFSTLNWRTMVDPDSSGGPVSILLVGNNVEAKAVVAALAEGMGLEPIDLGPIRYAHYIEGMLVMWANRYLGGQQFEYHLRKTIAR